MASQEEVDTLNAALDQVSTDLGASITEVQDELNQIAAANPGVPLDGVLAKVAALDEGVRDVANLRPVEVTPQS